MDVVACFFVRLFCVRLVLFAWGVLGAAFGGLLVVYALGGRPREPLAIAMIVVASSVAIGWRLSGLNATIFEVLPALVSAWLVYGVGRVCGLSGPAK